MSTDNIPSLWDDSDMFNISDFKNKKPFYDVEPFVRELAPEFWHTIASVLRGEDVKNKDFSKIMSKLSDELVPYYESDGSIDDPKMAQLHETLVAIGQQL